MIGALVYESEPYNNALERSGYKRNTPNQLAQRRRRSGGVRVVVREVLAGAGFGQDAGASADESSL